MAITRGKLFQTLGIVEKSDVPYIDKLTHKAYEEFEKQVWRENSDRAPHGELWHTSFHGSRFPGAEKSCARKSIYGLMEIPEPEPFPPMLRATGEIGKAVENQILFRWGQAGLLIAGEAPKKDGESGVQQQFIDDESWLTGSIDAILGIPDWRYVLPVDVKSKSKEVIDKMKSGAQGYYDEHYAQVQAYIYLCTKFYRIMDWAANGWLPPKGAIIYYASRENPRHAHEFYVEADWDFINAGVERLLAWKEDWLNNNLPERPKDWKWTDQPCKWCPLKKHVCKPDFVAGITKISESIGLEYAAKIRPYNFEEIQKEIADRWKA